MQTFHIFNVDVAFAFNLFPQPIKHRHTKINKRFLFKDHSLVHCKYTHNTFRIDFPLYCFTKL